MSTLRQVLLRLTRAERTDTMTTPTTLDPMTQLDPRIRLYDVCDGEASVALADDNGELDTDESYRPFVMKVTTGGVTVVRRDGSEYTTPTVTGWAEGVPAGEGRFVGSLYPTRAAAANSLVDILLRSRDIR
jgi:hypothetical protein